MDMAALVELREKLADQSAQIHTLQNRVIELEKLLAAVGRHAGRAVNLYQFAMSVRDARRLANDLLIILAELDEQMGSN